MDNTCKNNYTKEEYMVEFGNDDSIKKCGTCPNFTYDNGICSCEKFSNEDKK